MYRGLLLLSPLAACCYTYYTKECNKTDKFGGFATSYKKIFLVHCANKDDDTANHDHIRESWDSNWDKREQKGEGEESEEVSATRTLILIRHGQYENAEHDKGRVLTELGRRQARETGERLKEMNLPISRIIHSDMARAVETASIIAKEIQTEVPIEMCSMLREGKPYRPQPDSIRREQKYYHRDGARIEAAFREFFHRANQEEKQNTMEIIVGHGNVFRFFVCRALQLSPDAWLRISLGNCSITIVTILPNGDVYLKALGGIGHLSVDNVSYK